MSGIDDVITHLTEAGKDWEEARRHERIEATHAYAWINVAYMHGIPETQIAKLAGCDRMTVRKALGKR